VICGVEKVYQNKESMGNPLITSFKWMEGARYVG
jgi:hypothetical protein